MKKITSGTIISKYDNFQIGYVILGPNNYDPNKYYPLLIAEHGNGEKLWSKVTAAQAEALLTNGQQVGYNILNSKEEYESLYLILRSPFGGPSWPNVGGKRVHIIGALVNEGLDFMLANYRIDQSKISLTGLSEGGADVAEYLTLYANKLAAAVPVACWPATSTSTIDKFIADSKCAIWWFQGDNDSAGGDEDNVGKYLNGLNNLGANVDYTIFTEDGHNMWDQVYQGKLQETYHTNINYKVLDPQPVNIFKWILQQKRVDIKGPWDEIQIPTEPTEPTNPIPEEIPVPQIPKVGEIGFLAEYYPNKNFEGTPKSVIDIAIDFDWQKNSYTTGGVIDNFSVRWKKYITVPQTGNYKFITTADDGIRLKIDNTVVVDDFTDHAVRERLGSINLEAGKTYLLTIEYYESTALASAKVEWSYDKTVITTSTIRELIK